MTDERRERELILAQIQKDSRVLAHAFRLPLRILEAERPNVRRRYGVCYSDGSIRIRLRHARTGRLLKYSSLVDTLCHELAHLRYFNHGERFQLYYRRILEYARRAGIYRPGLVPTAPPRRETTRPKVRAPVQLDLFGVPHQAAVQDLGSR